MEGVGQAHAVYLGPNHRRQRLHVGRIGIHAATSRIDDVEALGPVEDGNANRHPSLR